MSRNTTYNIAGILSIEEAFSLITNKEYERVPLFGQSVSVNSNSLRLQTFQRSLYCSKCGVKGKFFAAETHAKQKTPSYHLNLYGVKDDGEEVLMTCDHTIARSAGGSDTLDNTTTMCAPCNNSKAVLEGLQAELASLKARVAIIEAKLSEKSK